MIHLSGKPKCPKYRGKHESCQMAFQLSKCSTHIGVVLAYFEILLFYTYIKNIGCLISQANVVRQFKGRDVDTCRQAVV